MFSVSPFSSLPPSWESFKRKSIVNTWWKYPLTKPMKNICTKKGRQPQCFPIWRPMFDCMIKIIIMIRLIMVGYDDDIDVVWGEVFWWFEVKDLTWESRKRQPCINHGKGDLGPHHQVGTLFGPTPTQTSAHTAFCDGQATCCQLDDSKFAFCPFLRLGRW